MTDKEYIEAKDLDDFRDEIMDRFLSLCNYNDYNKLTLLRIGETIDEIYSKYVSKPLSVLTNADRIRAMNDEELANMLTDFSNNGGWVTETGREICYERHIEWLKQPAEES